MAGQTYTPGLKPGDRCIIYVNTVNSPTGWWWGIVDSVIWTDDSRGGWGNVEAHITGEFAFVPDEGPFHEPAYGSSNVKPHVNYQVFGSDRDTFGLVHRIRSLEEKANESRILLQELRGLIKSSMQASK